MRSVKSSLFEVSLMMFSVKRSINSEAIQKIYNIFFMSAILAKVNSSVYSVFFFSASSAFGQFHCSLL